MLEMTQSQNQLRLPSNFELALETSILLDDLYEFVLAAWHVVEPETEYVDNWHIHAICTYLQALFEGRIPSRNLQINVPPGSMKSLLTNVFFVAWAWAKNPALKFLCYSYSGDLTVRDSMKCRNLIGSQWYQERFSLTIDDRNDTKDAYTNTKGGYRFCFGMSGSLGGHRGDFILIDDPLEMSKADSEAERKKVNNAYDSAISSRFADPHTGKRVIIMQRLHEDDLCGHVLEKEDAWERLILPAEYEGERFVSSIGFKDPRTEAGQLLWPERFDAKELAKSKSTLGTRGYAGQHQQRPAPLAGNIFKKEWFETRYDPSSLNIWAIFISWDTASEISDDAAMSACVIGGLTSDNRLLIMYADERKLEFPTLMEYVTDIARPFSHKPLEVIIEKKSSGIQLIQTLRQTTVEEWLREHIIEFIPRTDKENRGALASPWCENGSVILPTLSNDRPWLPLFEERLFNFPAQKIKDMGDSFNQLVLYCKNYLADGLMARTGVN